MCLVTIGVLIRAILLYILLHCLHAHMYDCDRKFWCNSSRVGIVGTGFLLRQCYQLSAHNFKLRKDCFYKSKVMFIVRAMTKPILYGMLKNTSKFIHAELVDGLDRIYRRGTVWKYSPVFPIP